MNRKVRAITTQGLLLGMAILLQLIEPAIPAGVPGVKLGLANIMGLIALYLYGERSMLTVNLLRVFLAALLRGTIFGTAFWLSLSGVSLSSAMVILLHRKTNMSMVGLAVASSVFHCAGQILAVIWIYRNVYIAAYLPMMWLLSIPTGLLTGILARLIVAQMDKGGGKAA